MINILLRIDGVIYDFVNYLYSIFDYLAKINIFENTNYISIVSRMYTALGLIMLFVLAYTLLKAVVNPESFSKGEQTFAKLIQNVVVSLVIIAILPTVFSLMFNIQNSILNYDTIPKLILGRDEYSAEEYGASAGKKMAFYTFTSFFHENEEWCSLEQVSGNECREKILGNG